MKMKLAILFISILLIFFSCSTSKTKNINHVTWKDTVQSFADGKYQILRSSNGTENLANLEYGNTIINQVDNYTSVDGKIYIIGSSPDKAGKSCTLYAIISTETGLMEVYIGASGGDSDVFIYRLDNMVADGQVHVIQHLSDFSAVDREIFMTLEHCSS